MSHTPVGGPNPCVRGTKSLSKDLTELAFTSRSILHRKDARTLALDLLSASQPEFSHAFRGSPMKRAKHRGLKRNASIVLGNVGASDDVPALVTALADSEPLVREHAAWALAKIGTPEALTALRAFASTESEGR